MSNAASMTISEIHAQTGIPKRTLQAAINRGDLVPSRKLGGVTGPFLISPASLQRYLAKRTTTSATRPTPRSG